MGVGLQFLSKADTARDEIARDMLKLSLRRTPREALYPDVVSLLEKKKEEDVNNLTL